MKDLKVGIQLFTLREELGNDFKGVIRELKKMGYEGLEFAGSFGDMEPAEAADFLKSVELDACGVHTSLGKLNNLESDVHQYMTALGIKYCATSMPTRVESNWVETVKEINQTGELLKKHGITFTYHNHDHEFKQIEGQYALDYLYEHTEADNVQAELDTYWIKKGGADPIAYVSKYADRLPLLHLKDMDEKTESFTELGSGIINFKEIINQARAGATEWIIYEQDICSGSALASAEKSINYLKGLLSL